MRAQLMPLDGGPPVEIAKEMTLIGRQEDCDLRLDHKSVSKMHCVVVMTDGLLLLRDLGSTNGTRVNGTRVRRAALLPNDKLSVANFHYRVLFGAALEAVRQDEQTQRIDPSEMPHIVNKPAANIEPDSEIDQPILEVQKNDLPDAYPDDKKGWRCMFDKSIERFPVKEKYIYLTHCGIAPLYAPALRREHEVGAEQSRTGTLVYKQYDAILDGLREAAASLLHTVPDNLAFVKNTSEAIGLIANGYPFRPGEQVISYVHEYPANHYPWKRQEHRGVELVLLPDRDITGHAPAGRPVAWTMRDLEERVTKRTRIVALSHVQFASGYVADLVALADFCEVHGIDLVLDAAQTLGALPIDAEKLRIAAIASSGWKWLMGPIGTGLLYTSPKFRRKLDLTMVGAETMQQATDYLDHTWSPHASSKCFEYSTSPIALAAALECCVREMPLRYSVEAIADEIGRLQSVFLAALNRDRFRPVFADDSQRTSIVSLITPGDFNAARRALLQQNVICTERGGYLRVAPHFYNTEEEMERVAGLLNAMK